MTVWYENTSVTLLSTNWIDPEGDAISVRKLGLTAATVANIDWVANGGEHSITVNGFGFKVYESGLVTYDDAGVVTGHPTTGVNFIGKIYYTMWDGVLESTVAYTTLRFNGNVTADVVGPIPVSTTPSNGSAKDCSCCGATSGTGAVAPNRRCNRGGRRRRRRLRRPSRAASPSPVPSWCTLR